jgi:hypothetical protein
MMSFPMEAVKLTPAFAACRLPPAACRLPRRHAFDRSRRSTLQTVTLNIIQAKRHITNYS